MFGGLGASTCLINTNGRCLINVSINSITNSHEIVKQLYSMTDTKTSLNSSFSEIVLSSDRDVIIQLLSAYIHDYVRGELNPDIDKFVFVIKNLENISSITDLQKLQKYLDMKYKEFSHSKLIKTDFFIGLSLFEFITIESINFRLVRRFHRELEKRLRKDNDVYFLITIPDEIDNVYSFTSDDLTYIKTLFKIAITSTAEYICTDIICYEADESGFHHVIYYNILDSTFTDDEAKRKRPLRELLHDDDYVYVPCLLHFQKLHSDSLTLNGTFKRYEELYEERIQFIKEQISHYKEPWIRARVRQYMTELTI